MLLGQAQGTTSEQNILPAMPLSEHAGFTAFQHMRVLRLFTGGHCGRDKQIGSSARAGKTKLRPFTLLYQPTPRTLSPPFKEY